MSLAPGTTGGTVSIERLEDCSYPSNGSVIASGVVVTADNGNMYMVSIGDDGMFSAEFVQPAPLSIPLGQSGSSVQVRVNEDRTYSAMINGEWMVITAETTVTAANGNVYAAQLSPEGVPIGVMHVPAMQEVMLGEYGGTVTVTQAEDMTWSIGDVKVIPGDEVMSNDRTYIITQDAEGMWTAMYQPVYQTVALGTQGSIMLKQAEDMSWWQETEGNPAADVGTEVMSDNGNTYTLWYTDGAWSARFKPESMMIEGTGLTAMTREGDDMYDVGDSTLPASGKGDVMDGDAMYHVWMQDGALAGARFDAAFDGTTDYTTNNLAAPALSANDPDTNANELRTHLIITGSAAEKNEGMFSFSDLLGSGMATDEGDRFVEGAVETISKVRSDVEALLALATPPPNLEGTGGILETQWEKLNMALDTVFKTDSDAGTDPTSALGSGGLSEPRQEDILDEIDDILDALASEDAFVAATAADGGGVFKSQELSASAAVDTFNRMAWTAAATMGATGATRYGTAMRKTTANARDGLTTAEVGAFSYSTMAETVRTADAAAISLTGIASYSGGTEAISGDGTTYSGTMDLQVRFGANSVSGVVKDLINADGMAWQYNFADVDRIVLDNARLLRNSTWNNQAGADATVFFTADSGLLRPINGVANTFRGILLGTGADAGSQASGVWEVNRNNSSTGTTTGNRNYLTGGFGVTHVGDTSRPRPGGDAGGASSATLMTTASDTATAYDASTSVNITPMVEVKDGKLTVKVAKFGWQRGSDGTNPVQYVVTMDDSGNTPRTPDDNSDDELVRVTAEFDLEALAGKAAGAKTTVNGPKWADSVKTTLQAQRDQIATLQALGTRTASTREAEAAAWQIARDAIQYQLFGGDLPMKLAGDYATDTDLQEDALDHIDRALDALSNATNLFAALDPEGTGIFDHYDSNADGNPAVVADDDIEDFIYYDSTTDRRWETTGNNRTLSAFLGERQYKVIASLGTTNYTRFGVWYHIGAASAERQPGPAVRKNQGGPGSFAYSPLDPTMAGNATNPAFPVGGSARYVGETVAIMDEDTLTGTARVDVSWASATTTTPLDLAVSADGTTDVVSHAGTMSLTIGDLVDSTGDPLTYFVDGTSTGAGQEIAEIVFDGMLIEVGLPGGNSGQLIVGAETAGTAADGVTPHTYSEIALTATDDVRYRLSAIGMSDQAGSGTASVAALFVGQGVDGPLGVIGTFTLDDDNVARVNAAGTGVEEGGVVIHGGFGADIP